MCNENLLKYMYNIYVIMFSLEKYKHTYIKLNNLNLPFCALLILLENKKKKAYALGFYIINNIV